MASKATCPHCDKTIFSLFRHDYATCQCGAINIDGGDAYIKFGWDPDRIDPTKINTEKATGDEIEEEIQRRRAMKDGKG